jgi:hypothetical protein
MKEARPLDVVSFAQVPLARWRWAWLVVNVFSYDETIDVVPLDGYIRLLDAGDVLLSSTPWGPLVARCCPGVPVSLAVVAEGGRHIGCVPSADLAKLRKSIDDFGPPPWWRLRALDQKYMAGKLDAEETMELISL